MSARDKGIDLDGKRVKPGIHFTTGDKIRGAGTTGTTYSENDLVTIAGYVNGYPRFVKANATAAAADTLARGPLFVLLHDVTVATTKPVLRASPWRLVTGVDTSTATAGDPVYLSNTAGGWSLSAGGFARQVGRVVAVSASAGVVFLDGRLEATLGVVSGTATIATGTDDIGVGIPAAWNGKPVVACVSQVSADATLTHVVRAVAASNSITITGNANATADVTVSYMIDVR